MSVIRQMQCQAAATLQQSLQHKAAMLCWLHQLLCAGGCQTAVPRLQSVDLHGPMTLMMPYALICSLSYKLALQIAPLTSPTLLSVLQSPLAKGSMLLKSLRRATCW